jgi:hypothetical protein
MVQLKIKVTKEILMKSRYCGTVNTGESCAIACAVRDIFPNAYVGTREIFVNKEDLDDDACKQTIQLPEEATEFIHEFDKGNPASRTELPELEFIVDIPDAVIDHINIDEIRPLLTNHPTLELIEA